jgi:hypothetical protein
MPTPAKSGSYRVRVTSDPIEDPDPEPGIRRTRPKKRRVPRIWWIAGVVVLALAFWAATSIGDRPEFESGSGSTETGLPSSSDTTQADRADPPPDDSGTRFTTNAPVLPSAGCAAPDAESDISDAELTVDGSVLALYSVVTPADDEPAPLVVLVGEPGLPIAELAPTSALFDVNPGWVHVGVDPLVSAEQLGELGIPELLEQTVTDQCVDLSRVFVVGFGEGGRAVGAAACSAPQLITGVAMVAGWTEPSCSLDPRVAVRVVGSADDPTTDTGTALEEVGGAWATAIGAGEQVVDGRDEDTLVRNWYGPGGATVETTTTVAGGHTWTVAASLALGPFLKDTARSLG